MPPAPASPAAMADALDAADSLPDEGVATAAILALRMGRPLLLEREAGVGKTSRRGGEVTGPLHRERVRRPCRVVLLVAVTGSMAALRRRPVALRARHPAPAALHQVFTWAPG